MAGENGFAKFGRTISPEADPTRTRALRAQLVAEERKRWGELMRVITESVVDNDVFGLAASNELAPLPRGSLAGLPPDKQIEGFLTWLDEQEGRGVLELRPAPAGPGTPWVRPNLSASFAKGVQKGAADLRAIGAPLPVVTTASVVDILALPAMESALNLEVLRTWNGLTGAAQQANAQVARVLAEGLEAGLSPLELARNINDRVDKIGLTRSELIARTEVVRAHNLGSVAEYARAELTLGEPVLTQWHATLDNRVRDNHLARHGKVFERDQALQLIGEPNCRCALLPYIESIEGTAKDDTAKEFTELSPGEAAKKAAPIRKREGLRKPGSKS